MKITIPKAAQGQNSAESRRLASRFAEAKKKTEATPKQAHLAKLRFKQARKAFKQAKRAAKQIRKEIKAAIRSLEAHPLKAGRARRKAHQSARASMPQARKQSAVTKAAAPKSIVARRPARKLPVRAAQHRKAKPAPK